MQIDYQSAGGLKVIHEKHSALARSLLTNGDWLETESVWAATSSWFGKKKIKLNLQKLF